MRKFFVVSDVHGFYDEMIAALADAGFDPNNEDHWFISCGDNFDRGKKPIEVMNYMMSLPRKILVRGNHEDLLDTMIAYHSYARHDIKNGTARTARYLLNKGEYDPLYYGDYNEIGEIIKPFFDSMVDYYETENYIFVHSWIAMKNYPYEWDEDWRNGSVSRWQDARWDKPFLRARRGYNQTGKTIVHGHWHNCQEYEYEYKKDHTDVFGDPLDNYNREDHLAAAQNHSIYRGHGAIGLDACTVVSHKVNVLVVEDETV